jgi:hypothetical protein
MWKKNYMQLNITDYVENVIPILHFCWTERKHGEDALEEYWYGKILTYPSEIEEDIDRLPYRSFDRFL